MYAERQLQHFYDLKDRVQQIKIFSSLVTAPFVLFLKKVIPIENKCFNIDQYDLNWACVPLELNTNVNIFKWIKNK